MTKWLLHPNRPLDEDVLSASCFTGFGTVKHGPSCPQDSQFGFLKRLRLAGPLDAQALSVISKPFRHSPITRLKAFEQP